MWREIFVLVSRNSRAYEIPFLNKGNYPGVKVYRPDVNQLVKTIKTYEEEIKQYTKNIKKETRRSTIKRMQNAKYTLMKLTNKEKLAILTQILLDIDKEIKLQPNERKLKILQDERAQFDTAFTKEKLKKEIFAFKESLENYRQEIEESANPYEIQQLQRLIKYSQEKLTEKEKTLEQLQKETPELKINY